MTTYKLTGEAHVLKDGVVTIPTADTPELPNANADYLEYKRWLLAGGVPEPVDPPSIEDQIAVFDAALVAHLDATARERRYDNRVTCALRAGYPGPFQAEGIAFAAWMDQCNALAYQLLAEVVAGTRPLPSSPQALIDLMPPMVWPS